MDKGKLYVVATPLGNLADITLRALDVLKGVDTIIAEDTRHSQRLLQHYGIQQRLIALHAHNEKEQSLALLQNLLEGAQLALISDAGTPLISDPGYRLVQLAHENHIPVSPIPGPCAAIAALSGLGIPCHQFVFMGFLPPKTAARQEVLENLRHEVRTAVFYEAPHRIMDTLQEAAAVLGGERRVGVARELTKMYETLRVGTLADVLNVLIADTAQQRGEFVLVIAGIEEDSLADESILPLLTTLLEELSLKQAVSLCTKITGQPKNKIYELALSLDRTQSS